VGIEDSKYRVYVEQHPQETLHTGSIWECERWISKNGVIGVVYVIDHLVIKVAKTTTDSGVKTHKAQPLF